MVEVRCSKNICIRTRNEEGRRRRRHSGCQKDEHLPTSSLLCGYDLYLRLSYIVNVIVYFILVPCCPVLEDRTRNINIVQSFRVLHGGDRTLRVWRKSSFKFSCNYILYLNRVIYANRAQSIFLLYSKYYILFSFLML